MTKSTPRKFYRKKLALLFGSTAAISFSCIAVVNHIIVSGINIGVELITFILKLSIPSAIVLGYIGYLIGVVAEKKPKKKKNMFSNFQTFGNQETYQLDSIFSAPPEGEEVPASIFGEENKQMETGVFDRPQENDPTIIGGV